MSTYEGKLSLDVFVDDKLMEYQIALNVVDENLFYGIPSKFLLLVLQKIAVLEDQGYTDAMNGIDDLYIHE